MIIHLVSAFPGIQRDHIMDFALGMIVLTLSVDIHIGHGFNIQPQTLSDAIN